MNYRYGVSVVGIDYNDIAIQRAHAVAEAAGLSTRFDVADLFLYTPETPFDVVVSLGVLHHTNDCGGGLTRVCQEMVRPGGHILIGLYHRYGRRPFSEYFAKLKASGASYTDLLAEYRRLDPRNDETHLISWFAIKCSIRTKLTIRSGKCAKYLEKRTWSSSPPQLTASGHSDRRRTFSTVRPNSN